MCVCVCVHGCLTNYMCYLLPLSLSPSQYYVTASLRLEHMLKCPHVSTKNIFFIFSNLARITKTTVQEEDSDWLQYIASVFRSLFSFNFSRLQLENELPHLPDYRKPNFGVEFAAYCTYKEWQDYVRGWVSQELVLQVKN